MADKLIQRNIEIKARCPNPTAMRGSAIALGARTMGQLIQSDTYFVIQRGRLKLRETLDARDELIYYNRPDSTDPKASEYWLVPVSESISLKALLATSLGVAAIVRKRRELLLWQNVRIHLDHVENLGDFIELEAVVGPDADEAESRRRVDELMSALRIDRSDLIAGSYVEMIASPV